MDKKAGGAVFKVGEDAKAKRGAGWNAGGGNVMRVVVALGDGVKLIQQGCRKGVSVADIQEIIVGIVPRREADHGVVFLGEGAREWTLVTRGGGTGSSVSGVR